MASKVKVVKELPQIKTAEDLIKVLQAHVSHYGNFNLVMSKDAEGNSFHSFGRFEVGETDTFFLYPSDEEVEVY